MAFAPKGAYNRAPIFNGDHFDYWKSSMRIHINSFDGEVWNAIENGLFVPTITDPHGIVDNKPMAQWTEEEMKKVNYDAMAQNILISSLGIDQFYHVSHCQSAKEMWDTLVTHFEGTNDVKISKINTLTQEFELFYMLDGETIEDMQQRFIKITNKLHGLGKPITNQDATNKILRCLSRCWQPKVTAIKEANDLTTLSLTTLFGKLTEHEQVLNLLEKHEKSEKKGKHNDKDKEKEKDKRFIALKTSTSKSTKSKKVEQVESSSSEDDSDDEEMELFVRRYNRYVRKKGIRHSDDNLKKFRKDSGYRRKNEDVRYSKKRICYECGQVGHYKPDCPNLKRKEKESSSNKRRSKGKKAYVARKSSNSSSHSSSSASSSDEGEVANVCVTTHHHKKKDKAPKKVNQNPSSSYTLLEYHELQVAFEKLHKETQEAFQRLKGLMQVNKYLEAKVSETEHELKALKESMIQKPLVTLDSCGNNKTGCDGCFYLYRDLRKLQDKLKEPSKPEITFAVDPSKFNKSFKSRNKKYKFVEKDHKKSNPHIVCHYCCNKGHTIAKCHARKILVPKGKLQWLPKLGNNVDTNQLGPNMSWGPTSNV
ncbi:gag-protease polyprotein [Trifolium repens]|nr:gag-protease polyprotein [Trifolium repens]